MCGQNDRENHVLILKMDHVERDRLIAEIKYYAEVAEVWEEQAFWCRYKAERTALAESAARYLLDKYYQTKLPPGVSLEKDTNYLCGGLVISIAFAEEYVMTAVSNGRLGVELQRIKEIDLPFTMPLAQDDEYNEYIKRKHSKALFDVWACKESFIKCVADSEVSDDLQVNRKRFFYKGSYYYFHRLELDPNYIFCICSDEEQNSYQLEMFNEEKFLHQYQNKKNEDM